MSELLDLIETKKFEVGIEDLLNTEQWLWIGDTNPNLLIKPGDSI